MPWCCVEYNTPFYWFLFLLLVWQWPWKGVALWRAAKKNQLTWFIVLFLVNSAAILEILYIFWWSKIQPSGKENWLCRLWKKFFKR